MKKVYTILAILIVALVLLSIYWQNTNSPKNGITLDFDGTTKFLSFNKLQKFEHSKVLTANDQEFNGFKLQEIISLTAKDEIKSIVFSSQDGMSVGIQAKDISNSYLCLIKKNDKKYYQLVVINDPFSQRWIKYINRITIQ